MGSLIDWLLHISAKDGILAVLVMYLLITDRMDRKADRDFYAKYFSKKDEKEDK